MGYRSDVRIATSKKGFEELKKYVNKYLKDRKAENYNIMDDFDVEACNDEVQYFGWDSIKWYDGIEGYEHIDAVVEGLHHLSDNDMGYSFARIGESYDDIEEMNCDSEEEDFHGYIPYPSMIRAFADDEVREELDNMDLTHDEVEVTI